MTSSHSSQVPSVVHTPIIHARSPHTAILDAVAGYLIGAGGATHSYLMYGTSWTSDKGWPWSALFDIEYGKIKWILYLQFLFFFGVLCFVLVWLNCGVRVSRKDTLIRMGGTTLQCASLAAASHPLALSLSWSAPRDSAHFS